MIKNWAAATGWAILLWILSFIVLSVIVFAFPAIAVTWQYLIALIIQAGLILFVASMYFRSYPGTTVDGLVLGIWFIVVGSVLDWIVTIPVFGRTVGEFYGSWNVWVGYIITLALTALATKASMRREILA